MKKIFAALLTGMALLNTMAFSSAEAGKLDPYRDMLAQKKFTLRYENITPLPRVTNKDKISFYGKNGMAVDKASFLLHKPIEGIVVVSGDEKYEEVANAGSSLCSLTKGEVVYYFTKDTSENTPVIYGTLGKKNQVSAIGKNIQAAVMSGESYADSVMTRLLLAMMPASSKGADAPVYKFVDAGELDNGLSYEDYKEDNSDVFEAVRYYFNGDTLVKIAAANYYVLSDGRLDGDKFIIKVKAFSPVPEMAYLQLPAGVKDVTKKDKEE